MELTGDPDGPPTRVGVSLIDSMSGLTGIVGLLACLLRAKHDGRGLRRRHLPLRRRHAPAHLSRPLVPERRRCLAARAAQRASLAGAGPDLSDQGRLDLHHVHDPEVLAVARARRWAASDLVGDPRFPDPNTRAKNRAALLGATRRPTFRTRTTDDWLAASSTACCRRRPSIASIRRSTAPSRATTGMVSSVPHPVKGEPARPRQSLRIDGERPAQAACAPLGADNDSLLGKTS